MVLLPASNGSNWNIFAGVTNNLNARYNNGSNLGSIYQLSSGVSLGYG